MMKDRPIHFTAPMVRGLLAGTKTQTRRIVKPHREDGGEIIRLPSQSGTAVPVLCKPNGEPWDPILCPFGQPGDRLWVCEGWRLWGPSFDGEADLMRGKIDHPEDPEWAAMLKRRVEYREGSDDAACNSAIDGWRPSIHMPRWASRITLELTSVRVERLDEISENDAKAEGITSREIPRHWGRDVGWSADWSRVGSPNKYALNGITTEADICLATARHAFWNLWESIYGLGSWDAKPLVWVLEFKRVEVPHE